MLRPSLPHPADALPELCLTQVRPSGLGFGVWLLFFLRVDNLGCSFSGLGLGFRISGLCRALLTQAPPHLRVEAWSINPGFHAHLVNKFTYIYICTYNMYIVDICK